MNVLIENYVKGLPRGNITNESECSICKFPPCGGQHRELTSSIL